MTSPAIIRLALWTPTSDWCRSSSYLRALVPPGPEDRPWLSSNGLIRRLHDGCEECTRGKPAFFATFVRPSKSSCNLRARQRSIAKNGRDSVNRQVRIVLLIDLWLAFLVRLAPRALDIVRAVVQTGRDRAQFQARIVHDDPGPFSTSARAQSRRGNGTNPREKRHPWRAHSRATNLISALLCDRESRVQHRVA
jgi:hypothetical protein